MTPRRNLAAAAFLGVFFAGCCDICCAGSGAAAAATGSEVGTSPTPATSIPAPGTLYARLGGAAKVTAVVNETIDKVAADPRMNQSFDKVDLKRVKSLLVEQICSLSGGGCGYTGDSMKDVHAGHRISNAEFYGLVEVLRDAMRHHDIPLSARNELLGILAPMKRDVVEP
ncbi:MAG: group 1 truncated hemoglobin [Gammaproteobacteria bacterium]